MTNDRFEEFLKSAVHDFDPVPQVPVEEMWARIDQARRFRRPAVVPVRRAPAWRRAGGWAVAAAALLAVGFGIGRYSGLVNDEATPPVAANATDAGNTRAVADRTGTVAVEEKPQPVVDQPSMPRSDRAVTRPPQQPGPSRDAGNGAYRLAALSHLSRAEGLLTSVAVGEVDEQLTNWARDMLSTTRLMLDSPAAEDPRMARLLEDLELILAQIASTTEDRKDAELQWIQQGLETNNVLPRLRAALPAGRALPGT